MFKVHSGSLEGKVTVTSIRTYKPEGEKKGRGKNEPASEMTYDVAIIEGDTSLVTGNGPATEACPNYKPARRIYLGYQTCVVPDIPSEVKPLIGEEEVESFVMMSGLVPLYYNKEGALIVSQSSNDMSVGSEKFNYTSSDGSYVMRFVDSELGSKLEYWNLNEEEPITDVEFDFEGKANSALCAPEGICLTKSDAGTSGGSSSKATTPVTAHIYDFKLGHYQVKDLPGEPEYFGHGALFGYESSTKRLWAREVSSETNIFYELAKFKHDLVSTHSAEGLAVFGYNGSRTNFFYLTHE